MTANRTAELRLEDLYNSQHPLDLQQPEVVDTRGATYDPISGTAVFDSALETGAAMTAEQRLQILRAKEVIEEGEVGQAHSLSPVFGPGGVVISWE